VPVFRIHHLADGAGAGENRTERYVDVEEWAAKPPPTMGVCRAGFGAVDPGVCRHRTSRMCPAPRDMQEKLPRFLVKPG
jgi:hypothetical protein